jgi:hypothetical protein
MQMSIDRVCKYLSKLHKYKYELFDVYTKELVATGICL